MTGGRIDLGVGFGRRGEASQEDEFKIPGLDPRARMKMSEGAVHICAAAGAETTSPTPVTLPPSTM